MLCSASAAWRQESPWREQWARARSFQGFGQAREHQGIVGRQTHLELLHGQRNSLFGGAFLEQERIEDATRAFRDLGARLLCAMHWGTFKLTDEPLDEPPILLEDERKKQGVAAGQVWVAAIGESRRL